MASAAMLNGISSHTFDFDDTHLRTIIHPAGPVASAAFALAEHTGASGRELIDAVVLGIDVSCRVGNAIYPDHYDRGWHITGSTGMLGAAAACARLCQPRRGADGDGARDRRVAAGRRPRAVRHDDEGAASGRRGARGPDGRAPRQARLHGVDARDRSAARPRCRRTRRSATGAKSPTGSARASKLRSTRTSRSRAASSSIRRSTAACSCAMRIGSPRRISSASTCACIRSCSS